MISTTASTTDGLLRIASSKEHKPQMGRSLRFSIALSGATLEYISEWCDAAAFLTSLIVWPETHE
jgi:hypothetical protein